MGRALVELRAVLGETDAWLVGGTVRDRLLGRPSVDLDAVCADPEAAARALARRLRAPAFALSAEHGGWRVVLTRGGTVDLTPLRGTIVEDLARRDFTVNAMADPVRDGALVDPLGGRQDLGRRLIRHASDGIFRDDPLRLLRAVRLAGELCFRLAPETEALVREHAALVTEAAGERVLAELERLSPGGMRELERLGLLRPLGGSAEGLRDDGEPVDLRLVRVLGENVMRLPLSGRRRRLARMLLEARPPPDASTRAVHRFRRRTEPWALEALAFLGRADLRADVLRARAAEPAEPLLRGDELEIAPGPERGRLLELIAEERAAGTITTREEALERVRREVALRPDGSPAR